ncbi:hypothetical protein TRAPUB_4435 [Trametes pubescens]|uniref:Uncharacterized protein n=1 Tax=Trametes pubescens TaxID=154538 RepID=A0A1M2VBG0_TRAPU|nr:hypothetical protein TRAPUB_4435 [Trametes pubescens]
MHAGHTWMTPPGSLYSSPVAGVSAEKALRLMGVCPKTAYEPTVDGPFERNLRAF